MSNFGRRVFLVFAAFAITTLFVFFNGAYASTLGAAVPDPTVDPGGWVSALFAGLQGGMYALVAAVLLFGIDQGALYLAKRRAAWAPAVPWLAAGGAILGTTAAALASSGEKGLRALPVALLIAIVGYMTPSSKKPAASAAPRVDGQAGRVRIEAMAAVVVSGVMVGLALSCGPLTKQIAHDAATCARAEVAGAVQDMVNDVEAILVNGSPAWRDELHAIEAQAGAHGGSALLCAVQAAIADLDLRARAGGIATSPGVRAEAAERGRAYLAAEGN